MPSGVEVFETLNALPPGARRAFSEPGMGDLFDTQAWYDTVIRTALPPRAAPRFAVAGDIVLPLMLDLKERRLQSLTTPYSCAFAPLVAPGTTAASLAAAAGALAAFMRGWGTVRLDALSDDCAPVAALTAAARSSSGVSVRFNHFGNWYEPVAGIGWQAFLAARDGALRETVRRKLRRNPASRFELVTQERDVERGITAYESVYGRSWKEPEPFPGFNPALMRVTARLGLLRLGLLHGSDGPVAAQFWVVSGHRASVLKLAHDERHRTESPGTVLTATMIRSLLEEGVRELDFGRGDDAYKRLWASRRRQRVGVVLANPWRPSGAAFLARHAAGRLRRAIMG